MCENFNPRNLPTVHGTLDELCMWISYHSGQVERCLLTCFIIIRPGGLCDVTTGVCSYMFAYSYILAVMCGLCGSDR